MGHTHRKGTGTGSAAQRGRLLGMFLTVATSFVTDTVRTAYYKLRLHYIYTAYYVYLPHLAESTLPMCCTCINIMLSLHETPAPHHAEREKVVGFCTIASTVSRLWLWDLPRHFGGGVTFCRGAACLAAPRRVVGGNRNPRLAVTRRWRLLLPRGGPEVPHCPAHAASTSAFFLDQANNDCATCPLRRPIRIHGGAPAPAGGPAVTPR